ncbi:hypothetical protein AB0H83_44880, partial [Dactylosporangium sp. NPDC050688]
HAHAAHRCTSSVQALPVFLQVSMSPSNPGRNRILIAGKRHLASVLTEYTAHYNDHRPHRPLGQQPPNPPPQVVDLNAARVQRRPILGGLINEYTQAA